MDAQSNPKEKMRKFEKKLEKNMMCDKNFFLENAISFLFFNRIQNGFHRPEGLIFHDLMHLKKN